MSRIQEEKLITYFDTIAPERARWKRKNRYYYEYLEDFLRFVVPQGKKVFETEVGDTFFWKEGHMIPDSTYDYVVAKDVLGYTEDVQSFMEETGRIMCDDGRIVITQYSALWEPILRLASLLRLRMPHRFEQNWLSLSDIKNFAHLAGFEVVKSGSKMIFPKYIPLISAFLNRIVANIFPFTRAGLFHYVVIRKPHKRVAHTEPSFSIVVPARNEAGTIEKIVRELPAVGAFTEIIFIEGNSSDNTYDEIVRVAEVYKDTKRIKYAKQSGIGKGDAVRKGFGMAQGDVFAIYDADMTVPAYEMEKFYRAIADNKADFINGSRLVYPLEKDSMRMLNFFANKFFGLAFSFILGQTLKDTLCGTKVIWKKDYEMLERNRKFFGDFDPFGDFDLLFGAAKLNLKIIDLPIHYKERTYGSTNISRFKHGWLLLKMTFFAAHKILINDSIPATNFVPQGEKRNFFVYLKYMMRSLKW